MESTVKEHFTDTIFYQIELTAKYCKLLGQQFFEKLDAGLSLDEYAVLDLLTVNESLCQRDIAKLILKDRANTGKILDSLAKKNGLTRELTIKNNRPVRMVKINNNGMKMINKIALKTRPHHSIIKDKLNKRNLMKVGTLLEELRNVLKETIDINI